MPSNKYFNVVVEDREVKRYLSYLSGQVQGRLGRTNAKWLYRFTRFGEKRMKRYAKGRTDRSSGNLSSKISTSFTIGKNVSKSQIFVPPSVKYQFAAEHGFQRQDKIFGRPKMTFPASSWKKATVKVPNRGYFVFARVTRGRYEGLHYTERSYRDLEKYAQSKISDMQREYISVLRG